MVCIKQITFTTSRPWTVSKTACHTKNPLQCLSLPRLSPNPSHRCLRDPRVAFAPPPTVQCMLHPPVPRPSASRQPARQRTRASRRETLQSAPSKHEVLLSMSRGIQAPSPRQNRPYCRGGSDTPALCLSSMRFSAHPPSPGTASLPRGVNCLTWVVQGISTQEERSPALCKRDREIFGSG